MPKITIGLNRIGSKERLDISAELYSLMAILVYWFYLKRPDSQALYHSCFSGESGIQRTGISKAVAIFKVTLPMKIRSHHDLC